MTDRRHATQEPDPPRLTMRVTRIRDGRVIERGEEIRIMADASLEPLHTSAWPPCQCPRHRGRNRG
ncbi:hypothetical protein GCM10018787_11110 [Streptomyces thermodiastaticus]|nr:hypothetical protein GCM10018787_11110 [Streptomyces thermodiastaticus]